MRNVAAGMVTNRQTDTQTHTQNDYCNPSAHVPMPRVKYVKETPAMSYAHTRICNQDKINGTLSEI